MRKVTLLIALAVLVGCQSIQTTRALGSLQAEYGNLVRTEESCDAGNKADEACLGDFPAMYGSIEAQAEEVDVHVAEPF